MEPVSTTLSTNQFNMSPVPSQVNVAVIKGGTVTGTGGTVMTRINNNHRNLHDIILPAPSTERETITNKGNNTATSLLIIFLTL